MIDEKKPVPLITTTPSAVYSAPNIQQIDIPSNRRAMDMKLEDLTNKLSKANSIGELNQIEIMNQPKAMGVLTGEASYRSKLDTARINAFNSLYNNRLQEEQRKQAERDAFKAEWGVDPSTRPDGMSKSEFKKKLLSEGVMPMSQYNQEKMKLDLASARKSLAGTPAADKMTALKTDLTSQIYSGALNREAAKAIFQQQYPEQDPNWVYTAAPDSYEQNIKSTTKPATQAQYTVAGYAGRTEEANNTINNFEGYASGANPLFFGVQSNEKYPNWLKSSEFQQYDQASRNFINAVLRRESGAVISDQEFDNAYKQYLPKPGDSPATLEQKRRNREMVINNLKNASGSAYSGTSYENQGQDIEVVDIATGLVGRIPVNEFDGSKYYRTGN